MSRTPLKIWGTAVFLLTAGCSSKPLVVELRSPEPKLIAGVPFRVKETQILHIFALQPDGTYKEVSAAPQVLADYSRLYAIDVSSQPFASSSLHIAEAADNTLSTAQITGTDQTAAALDAVNSGIGGITKGGNDKTAAALTAANAANTADKALRDAQDALDKLSPDASPATRAIYQQAVESARRAATLARQAAGLPSTP